MKRILVLFLVIIIQSCTSGHQKYYTQISPTKYPPTESVMNFSYLNVNLNEIYNLLFSDFLIIGSSNFIGSYDSPESSESFAKSIGTDVFLASLQFGGTTTSLIPLMTPTTNTTYISGYSGASSFNGKITSFGTRTTAIPIVTVNFKQSGLYLKNINNIMPIWERTEVQYPKTEKSELEGLWLNENYKINTYKSGEQLVAFTAEKPKVNENWDKGQLKFVYNLKTGIGTYLMASKAPMPAKFQLNKFGHIEVNLVTTKDSFSFARPKETPSAEDTD